MTQLFLDSEGETVTFPPGSFQFFHNSFRKWFSWLEKRNEQLKECEVHWLETKATLVLLMSMGTTMPNPRLRPISSLQPVHLDHHTLVNSSPARLPFFSRSFVHLSQSANYRWLRYRSWFPASFFRLLQLASDLRQSLHFSKSSHHERLYGTSVDSSPQLFPQIS